MYPLAEVHPLASEDFDLHERSVQTGFNAIMH